MNLPVPAPRPLPPVVFRPALVPIAGGIAAIALTASLAAIGGRWAIPRLTARRRTAPPDDATVIEIHESIVIRHRSGRIRLQ